MKPTRSKPAATPARKARTPTDRAAVLAAASSLAAAIRRGNKAAAEKLLARDFSFVDAAGKVHSRRSVLGNLKAGPNHSGTKSKVKTYSRVALVTGMEKSAQAGKRPDLFAVDIWVNGKDGWRALIHHNNVLAGKSTPHAHPAATLRRPGAKPPRCPNPLEFVPYVPKSQAERDIITASRRWRRRSRTTIRWSGRSISRTSLWSTAPSSIRPPKPIESPSSPRSRRSTARPGWRK
jgi:hypothetical protein